MWLLRRLKKLGASREALCDIYAKNVRSVLEFSAVVWHSSLTKTNTGQLERVQKAVCAITLDKQYTTYESACSFLNMDTLSERRIKLANTFAAKASAHPIHRDWFIPNQNQTVTRQKLPKFKPTQARTARFLNSAIPFLTECLNNQ